MYKQQTDDSTMSRWCSEVWGFLRCCTPAQLYPNPQTSLLESWRFWHLGGLDTNNTDMNIQWYKIFIFIVHQTHFIVRLFISREEIGSCYESHITWVFFSFFNRSSKLPLKKKKTLLFQQKYTLHSHTDYVCRSGTKSFCPDLYQCLSQTSL